MPQSHSQPIKITPIAKAWVFGIFVTGVSLGSLIAQSSPFEFSLFTGSDGTTSPLVSSFSSVTQLPQERSDTSMNSVGGATFLRNGSFRASRTDDQDLSKGLTLYAEAETTLNLADAQPVPAYTANFLRPYSRTELKVNRDRIEAVPMPGSASAVVRLSASLQASVGGIFPSGRSWRNNGRTFLGVTAQTRKKNNNQIQATFQPRFEVLHSLNATTGSLVFNNVTSIFGGGNGAWNPLSNSGSGFVDVVLPSDEYLEVTTTLLTEVEITQFGASIGNAASSFNSRPTGTIQATTTNGTLITSSLGHSKLRQALAGFSPAVVPISSPPVTLGETLASGRVLSFELLSGPGTLSGKTITLAGIRGTLFYRAFHPGDATYVPFERQSEIYVQGLTQGITMPGSGSFPANSAPFDPGATSSSGLPVVYEILGGPVTTDGRLITPTGATGSFSVRARQPGDDTYEPATPTDGFFFISAAVDPNTPQSISFPSLITAKAGEAQLVFVTASSGLPVILELIEGNGVFTGVNRNIFTPLAPGSVRIRATQLGGFFNGVSYQAAAPVERTFIAQTSGSTFSDAMILLNLPQNLRGPTDDADGDGVPNLVEFALGTNAGSSQSAITPVATTSGNPVSELRLNYRRVRNDVQYLVEGSPNLTSWSAVGISQGTPDGSGNVTASALISTGYRFLRLAVSQ